MTALFHHKPAAASAPAAVPCTSGAMFEVAEDDGTRTLTCATCFPTFLTTLRLLKRDAVYREVEPAPGLRCECVREVRR